MANFIIDGVDFGVDETRSALEFTEGTFSLYLVGDAAIINDLIQLDEHPWNWVIQPPMLYVRNVPGQPDPNGDFEHDITEQELDDYDIALYVTDHFDVLPCKLRRQGKRVTVSGKVHGLSKTPFEFSGEFEFASKQM